MMAKMPKSPLASQPPASPKRRTMSDNDPTAAPAAVPADLAATYVPADRYGFLEALGRPPALCLLERPGNPRSGTVVAADRPGRIHREIRHRSRRRAVGPRLLRVSPWIGAARACRTAPLADRNKGHIDNFATYMADLQLFLDKVVAPAAAAADPGALPFHGRPHHDARAGRERIGSDFGRRAGVAHDGAEARGHAAVGPDADARDPGGRGALPVRHRPLRRCSPASSTPTSSPTTSGATASPTSGSPPTRGLPWAARPWAGAARPSAP